MGGDMLSAFKAQQIHELKPKDKAKNEALLAYGDRLLVGVSTGSLRIFRILEPTNVSDEAVENGDHVPSDGTPKAPAKPSKAVELLHDEEKFSRRPVQQLAIVKEANLLVSLSDGCVSFHDLQSYQLIERIERTKGATCFAVTSNVVKDNETGVPSLVSSLAVAVKRKILVWTWQDMEQAGDGPEELSLEANVKSLVWITGARLMAGADPGYTVVDVQSGEQWPVYKPAGMRAGPGDQGGNGDLAGVRFAAVSSSGMGYMGMGSWVPKPMATRLNDREVLLAKDVNTLFTDAEGKPLEKRQIPWSLAPEAIGYSYPYLLALQPPEKGTLQIRNPDTLTLLQTISVPQAHLMHVPQPNISLAHAGKGFLVASDRIIWRMNAQDYDSQLRDMVDKHRFDEAVSLLNLLEDTLIEDKVGRIREIKSQKATHLFQQQKYRPALDLFTEAQAAPERVIALYPKVISGGLSGIPDDVATSDEEHEDEDTEAAKPGEPPSTPQKSMFGKLIPGSHKRRDSDSTSIRSSKLDSDNMSIRGKPSPAKQPDKPLEGNDLRQAALALNSFLAQARVRVKDHLSLDGTLKEDPPRLDSETKKPAFANLLADSVIEQDSKDVNWQGELLEVAKLVDTTLFRSYMLASPSLAGSLFRIDNFCDPEVVQTALYENARYNDLLDFLHGKKLHRQSLEMLAKFGKGQAEGEVPEGLEGPRRTVAYLKHLPPELVDIVLEYVRWPIDVDPELGMQVFLEDSKNAEDLPKDKVLEFLADIDGKLEERYLEHIINELGEQNPDFHQHLIDLYIAEMKQIASSDSGNDKDRQAVVKERLESFLRKSKVYNKAKTLQQLPKDDPPFYESRAIVLSAIGNHRQALSIYVFQIRDSAKADEYCSRVYLEQQAERQACLLDEKAVHEKPVLARSETEDSNGQGGNVFAMLLGLYLRPPAGEGKRWPEALELLGKHGARLPASSTLDLMPDDLAVKELQDYFRGRIRNATTVLRGAKVVTALESLKKGTAERLLVLGSDDGVSFQGRNRSVRITEDAHCKVCHRRFGASAVRVHPDGEVVHYGCVGKGGASGGEKSPRKGWLRNANGGWG